MNSVKEITLTIIALIVDGLIRLPKLTGLVFAITVIVLLRKIVHSHSAFFELSTADAHLLNLLAFIFILGTAGAGLYWLCTAAVRFVCEEGRAFFVDHERRHRVSLTPDTRYRCAVHEIGHLLAYKWYDTLPDNIAVYITNDARSGVWGQVSHTTRAELGVPRELIHDMYMLLAGSLAEACVLGSATIGASSDLAKWESTAKRYLNLTDQHQRWFAAPNTAIEAEHNLRILDALKREQTPIVEAFLEHNKALLEQGAKQLVDSRHLRLTPKQITALLDAVTFPTYKQEDKAA